MLRAKGASWCSSKISNEIWQQVHQLRQQGMGMRMIAQKTGVSIGSVHKALSRVSPRLAKNEVDRK